MNATNLVQAKVNTKVEMEDPSHRFVEVSLVEHGLNLTGLRALTSGAYLHMPNENILHVGLAELEHTLDADEVLLRLEAHQDLECPALSQTHWVI